MEKIFIVNRMEVDKIKNITKFILQTISEVYQGNMSEKHAIEIIKTNIDVLNTHFDDA